MSKKSGVTNFSGFLKRVSLLNLRVRAKFVAFPLERTRKSLEVRFDFGPRPGLSKQLFGSSQEGTELDWTLNGSWETDFLPLLVLAHQGRSTGKNQYW